MEWNCICEIVTLLKKYVVKHSSSEKVAAKKVDAVLAMCSIEKAALKNFAIFTGKRPVLESPFNRLAGFKTCNFLKKRHRCFPVNIAKFLRTLILMKIFEQLLLLFLLLTVNISS